MLATAEPAHIGELSPLTILAEYQALEPYLTPAERAAVADLVAGMALPPMPLLDFVRQAWPVVEQARALQDNWHIQAICLHLEAATYGITRNLLINIQPRHLKSLLVAVFWPAWAWTWIPSSQWLFLSHAEGLSTRDNRKRRRLMQSDWYRRQWGHLWEFAGDQNVKTYFENNRGGHMIAKGLGGVGLGADFIVGDDLLNREWAYSQARRDQAASTWFETASTRGNDPETVVKVMIAQRLHEDDPPGRIMQAEAAGGEPYDKLIIPTEYEPNAARPPTAIGWTDPRSAPGELLFPARYDHDRIAELKVNLGPTGASAQLQQRPADAGGNIIKRQWLKVWAPAGVSLPPMPIELPSGGHYQAPVTELPNAFDEVLQSVDANFKGSAGNSYVTVGVWARKGADFYLLDQRRDRYDAPQLMDVIRELWQLYPAGLAKLVEDKANGPAVIQMLQREIPGIISITPQGDKVSRANAVAPAFRAGNVYMPHRAIFTWVGDYIAELCSFPVAAFDDQVDQTTQALNYWLKPDGTKRAGTWGR